MFDITGPQQGLIEISVWKICFSALNDICHDNAVVEEKIPRIILMWDEASGYYITLIIHDFFYTEILDKTAIK